MYVANLNLLAATSAPPHLNNQHLTWLREDRENANVGLYSKRLHKHSPAPTMGIHSLATDFNRITITHHMHISLLLSKDGFFKAVEKD